MHGLWMRGWVMQPLAWRLQRAGFRTHTYSYPTVREGLEAATARLRAQIDRLGPDRTVHLIGHSLGGMVILNLLTASRLPRGGRAVLLGSPLTGNASARRLARRPLGRNLMGRNWPEPLNHGIATDHTVSDVGLIAGTGGLGLGRLLGGVEGHHDGVVNLEETRHPALTDHCVVPASHSGMLLSGDVAAAIVTFLRTGRFSAHALAHGSTDS